MTRVRQKEYRFGRTRLNIFAVEINPRPLHTKTRFYCRVIYSVVVVFADNETARNNKTESSSYRRPKPIHPKQAVRCGRTQYYICIVFADADVRGIRYIVARLLYYYYYCCYII